MKRTRDGRATRWETHRRARRAELVAAAITAVRRHGARVGMDEVATEARTSKTVVYRHFADRADLYVAVCARVATVLLGQIRVAMARARGPRASTAAAIGTYLRLVERDPEVYRFVVHRPLLERDVGAAPVNDLVALVGDQAAAIIGAQLAARGGDPAAAAPWGHGVVGLVQAAADNWLARPSGMTREELTEHLTELVWSGLSGVVPAPAEGDPALPRP
jgi:AcrR family transcriptional regulator